MPRVLLRCHAVVWRVGGSLLSLLRFHCGTKGLALCGVLLPSTPLWNVCALLCATALRYSSLMFRVPLWTSTKALEYPIWFLCASRLLVSLLCVGCSCVRVWFCPLCSAPLFLFRLLWLSCVCVPSRFLLVFGRLSCVLSRFVGAPVCCLDVEFVCVFISATQLFWSLAVSLPPLDCFCFCVSDLGGLFVLVMCWWAPCPVSSWGGLIGEVGPALEP